jgi:hypothetical protein
MDRSDTADGACGPPVAPHLRPAELSSTRQDAAFWQAVNQILSGSAQRYPHTPGEKKAAERAFKRAAIPIGVVLAALRAVMTLPPATRPARFGDALKLPAFHAAVQEALALLPTLAPLPTTGRDWHAFLHTYRQRGDGQGLRDVPPTAYAALHALFTAQPDDCWQVLERWQAAPPPRVSPATLRRAVAYHRQARLQPSLPWHGAEPARGSDDPRRALLVQAGLSPHLLTRGMSEDYLRAWLQEADARAAELTNRVGWLTWGIRSGHWPHEHPQLQGRRASERRPPPPPPAPPPTPISAEQQAWQALWSAVQTRLSADVGAQEYATWLENTALLELTPGQAVVGTPNIFARETVAEQYAPLIAAALQQQTRQSIQVQVVLEQAVASYGGLR